MKDEIIAPDRFPVHQIVTVELQVDCDVPILDAVLQHACEQAVENAVKLGVANGLTHPCEGQLSIGLVSVDAETGRWRCSDPDCDFTMPKSDWTYEQMAKNGGPQCSECNCDLVLESP